jgi:threonine dehydrogenase-like Zn-dependent dehydrogenase
MKAVVFHDVGGIRPDEVPEPKLEQGTDALVRITASASCGTDLHMIRGTLSTILGHEGVGVIERLGRGCATC